MRRILYLMLGGAAGAFLIWAATEPFAVFTAYRGSISNTDPYLMLHGALVGLGIGAGLGVAEGLYGGSLALTGRRILQGAAVGGAGGLVGIVLGQTIYGPWAAINDSLPTVLAPVHFVMDLLARSVGWAFIGLLIGAGQGLVDGSKSRLRNGFWGGLLGGALGGFLFQLCAEIVRSDVLARAIGFTCLGGTLGLALGLAQELLKHAWVRVMVGRNEGRETVLDKPVTLIGRDELADIGLFGDPAVGLQHAVIRSSPVGYVLQDAGNSTGTRVNGAPVQEQALRDGDQIEIGAFHLEFHERAGRAPAPAPVDVAGRPMAPMPSVSGVCAYCGTPKDPFSGACACAPAPAGAAHAMPTATAGFPPPAAAYSAAGTASTRLVATAGPLAGQVFPLPRTPITVGRENGRDIVVGNDPSVSRRHATLTPEPGGIRVTDEGSANGTFINGARVSSGFLRPGDELRVGATAFRVEG